MFVRSDFCPDLAHKLKKYALPWAKAALLRRPISKNFLYSRYEDPFASDSALYIHLYNETAALDY